MADMMTFPNTVEEFMEQYKIVDTDKVYTNSAELVPIFRMKQWFDHVSATDKNVGSNEDCINRKQALAILYDFAGCIVDTINGDYHKAYKKYHDMMEQLPPAQPEQPIDADGTLWITVTDIERVKRVIVDEEKSKFCRQFYMDEQRTGKWIPQDHNKRAGNISTCVYYYPICSECGQVGNETYKYCPHCGLKMISEGNPCDCYSDGRCICTKEIDPCFCGGVRSKCDFYENVRREGDAE